MDYDYWTVRSLIQTAFCCSEKPNAPLSIGGSEEFEHQSWVLECLDVSHLTETHAEYREKKPGFLFFWSYSRVICPARNLIPFLWIQHESNLVRRGGRVTKRRESNAECFSHISMTHLSMCHCVRYHILRDAFFCHILASFVQTQ